MLRANVRGVSNGRLVAIEQAIRKLVDMRKAKIELGWQHLYNLLRVGDSGRRRRSGRVTTSVFRAILQKTFRRQQFTLTEEEVIAIFMKYGHDAHGGRSRHTLCSNFLGQRQTGEVVPVWRLSRCTQSRSVLRRVYADGVH